MGQGPIAVAPANKSAGGLGLLNLDPQGNLKVAEQGGPDSAITPVAASSGNVAAATASATLASVAGKTTYLSGFSLTGAGATGASVVELTVTGLAAGTLTFAVPVPAGAAVGLTPLNIHFDTPLPASAAHVDIVVSVPTLGAGNLNTSVNAWGFNQ